MGSLACIPDSVHTLCTKHTPSDPGALPPNKGYNSALTNQEKTACEGLPVKNPKSGHSHVSSVVKHACLSTTPPCLVVVWEVCRYLPKGKGGLGTCQSETPQAGAQLPQNE
mmetsp:Transcript_65279/g.109396  ORF Transcript_65279/g.109396 Transcript_65279/m.109396 type:complete len:111 (+) Transcript_65279:631-963(+)|eukprot:CAMPEP_0174382238 /NCGR_PEP_ID=MMETSP0811_2-20130205/124484_1 /TAXON_ID=73025 ORGANISM="Eutreptiella gymnastica-like, Strain CCMP1594" /NCGR_SAMPLE_ID=MMETSP0811_2 /ASSEMBLY_ACC=CAM_ASM_000667 /LENGTH=110 /DNA_ID=CAMNT_0015535523 /DNA_START=627 /DNA_END=959 /DNA_ORIENTATION=-